MLDSYLKIFSLNFNGNTRTFNLYYSKPFETLIQMQMSPPTLFFENVEISTIMFKSVLLYEIITMQPSKI